MSKVFWVFFLSVVVLFSAQAFAVTNDSNTWENTYECSVLPASAGWIAAGGAEATWTSVSSGILTLAPDPCQLGWWQIPTTLNFTTGSSMEWRAKVNSVATNNDNPFVASLRFYDTAGNVADVAYGNNGTSDYLGGLAPGGVTPFDFTGWHIYRFTVQNNTIQLYIDNNPVPLISGATKSSTGSTISFGDFTGNGGAANWNIDYIRWTNQGAFSPPLPPATSDSSSWEGKYECNTLPSAAGWSAAGANEGTWTSVSNGILTMTPTAPSNPGWWEMPSTLNFTTGSSIEWRAQVNSVSPVDIPYCAYLRFNDTAGNLVDLGYDNTGSGDYLSGIAPGGMTPFDFTGWHTYRLTVQNKIISLYIDGNLVSGYAGSTANLGATNMMFGDVTWSTVSANWNLDYIRWTKQGAFVPAVCGDSTHPIPPGDLNGDCVVNFKDFAILSESWMKNTNP